MFCAEQWAAARDDGKYCVFEMAAATERQLVRLPKPMQQILVKRVVDGKLVQVEQSSSDLDQARRDAMLKFLAPALDGCLVLGPGARLHPAVEDRDAFWYGEGGRQVRLALD